MTEEQLKKRTKDFGIRGLNLVEELPNTIAGRIIAKQFGRSVTSVGANYRAARRARSKADFTSKLGIVEEEADESAYWLEIIAERKMLDPRRVKPLLREANELTAIMTSSRKTVGRRTNQKSKIKNQK